MHAQEIHSPPVHTFRVAIETTNMVCMKNNSIYVKHILVFKNTIRPNDDRIFLIDIDSQ